MDEFHVLTQSVSDESIMFVSAVKTDILSQEASAYAESDPLCHRNPFLSSIWFLSQVRETIGRALIFLESKIPSKKE